MTCAFLWNFVGGHNCLSTANLILIQHKRGKPKGVQAILEKQGLWQNYTAKERKERKPALKFHCTKCLKSNKQKDADEKLARLVHQAEDNGFFFTHKQSFSNLAASDPSFQDVNKKPNNGPFHQ
jgi:hypothetical protein